jgi:purine-binding chemotaxis protein CheW
VKKMAETTSQYCTFQVHDLYFGIEVMRVQEVMRPPEMTRVPLASSVVRGLINLRGQIVTALDLRRRLQLPERGDDQEPMNVVVRGADGPIALLVDEIGDVLEVTEASYEPPPPTLTGVTRDLVSGVHKLDQHLLLVLDTERAVSGRFA